MRYFFLLLTLFISGCDVEDLIKEYLPGNDPAIEQPAPVPVVTKIEEQGFYLGAGNPPRPDPAARPLWEFKNPPAYYGVIEITFGTAAPILATPNASGRWDGPGGIVVKSSDQTGKLRIHDRFGSKNTRCTIKYTK